MVRGLPSGPMTYFTLGRWGSVMVLSRTGLYELMLEIYSARLKIYLSTRENWKS
jgi:hypothetical protein